MSSIDSSSPILNLPTDVGDFILAAVVTGDMALPSRYPGPDDLEAFQVGFRSHGHTGENLVSTEEGAWQPGWVVIATNGFDDPFFIDMAEQSAGFPIYYAPHGAGRWVATVAARSLERFGWMLSSLRDLEGEEAMRFIETEAGTGSPLWAEIVQARREGEAMEGEVAEVDYDPEAIAQGDLIVVAIGPQKLKVVQLLRSVLDVSLQEALALAAEREIIVGSGPKVRFGRIERELTALGAAVEFRPHMGSAA
jgi:ribosomal protein L7/L12